MRLAALAQAGAEHPKGRSGFDSLRRTNDAVLRDSVVRKGSDLR